MVELDAGNAQANTTWNSIPIRMDVPANQAILKNEVIVFYNLNKIPPLT
jgi:hypothetical protein